MRYCLAAIMIPGCFPAVTGKMKAQSPEPQWEIDGKIIAQAQPEVLGEQTEFVDNFLLSRRWV